MGEKNFRHYFTNKLSSPYTLLLSLLILTWVLGFGIRTPRPFPFKGSYAPSNENNDPYSNSVAKNAYSSFSFTPKTTVSDHPLAAMLAEVEGDPRDVDENRGFDYANFLEESLIPDSSLGGKRVFHMLVTRLGQGMGRYPIHMQMRLDLFETFAFPSVLHQKGPFLWVIFADPDMVPEARKRFMEIIRPLRKYIVVVWTNRCASSLIPLRDYSLDFELTRLLKRVHKIFDVVVTSRLDADDVMHPDTFAQTRAAIANQTTPFVGVTWEKGYTWRPTVVEEGEVGRLRDFNADSLAVGMSMVADGPYTPLYHNVHSIRHLFMVEGLYYQCSRFKISSDTRPCYNDTRATITLPGYGWLYVRTLLSDSFSVMTRAEDPRLGDEVEMGKTDTILQSFGLDIEKVREINRKLPEYTKLFETEPVVSAPECGFKRKVASKTELG
eukprot:comp19220_c0_seq1/m.21980 comp19220_c0_seq1/g.21980  ORF comp19220_c0_seq1/g.21980 comp19220_c0_seq1/m.21980 type:complete len:439 (-) comp19220_c0_seq1:344-1660(-)